jgi:hypothetical protein
VLNSLGIDSELVIFEDTSHEHHLEKTGEYLGVVRGFLHRAELRETEMWLHAGARKGLQRRYMFSASRSKSSLNLGCAILMISSARSRVDLFLRSTTPYSVTR